MRIGLGQTIVRGGGAGFGAGGSAYVMNSVDWPDGANDIHYQKLIAAATMADSGSFVASMWVNLAGTTDGANTDLMTLDGGGANPILRLRRETGNRLQITAYANDSTTLRISRLTTTTFLAAGGWLHILFSADSGTNVVRIFVNNTSELNTTFNAAGNIGFSAVTRCAIAGTYGSAGFEFRGYSGDVWLTPGQFTTDTGLFRSAGGSPISLGNDGSVPFGAQPAFYFGGPYPTFTVSTYPNNLGSVGPGAWDIIGPGSLAQVFF